MNRFLRWLGLEVTVLGRLGIDTIFVAPPALLPVLPPPSKGIPVDELLAVKLVRLDATLTRAFTGRPVKWAPRGLN